MAQYIEKDALVAEIENRIKKYTLLQQKPEMSDLQEELQNKIDCLNSIKGYIINTLEVKEVNLEYKAELIANGIMCGVQSNKYNTVIYNTKRNDFNHSHLMLAARKGIELGLKAQKGE